MKAEVEPSRITVSEYLDEWMQRHAPKLKPGIAHSYKTQRTVHDLPVIGSKVLQELRPAMIQRMLDNMRDGKGPEGRALDAKTIAYNRGILHKALADATRMGTLENNPVDRTEMPLKVETKPAEVFTMEDGEAIFAAAVGTRWEFLIRLAFWSGLRRGEVCGLQ